MKKYQIYPQLQHDIGKFHVMPNDTHTSHIEELPFWCNNLDLSADGQDCCLTHKVGLPEIRRQKMPLADFQLEYCSKIFDMARTKSPDLPMLVHVNKGRQMGFTEIHLRLIQYFCFNRYKGQNVGIMAATHGTLAIKNMRRLYELFKPIKEVLAGPLTGGVIQLKNGTRIEAFPASEEAVTGDTKYACFLLDEAAKWTNNDDTPLFNSIMPIIHSCASDMFLVSTPKGPEKMFWKIAKEGMGFERFEYPITRALGSIHTNESLQHILDEFVGDVRQEYFCEFAGAKDRVFHFDEKDLIPVKAIELRHGERY